MDELMYLLGDREENRVAYLACLILERGKIDGETIAPHIACAVADKLASVAGLIKPLCEEACNTGLDACRDMTLVRREATFQRIAELVGFSPRTGGDPRGACAYIIDPAKPRDGDGWGEGWAVYR